MKTLRRGSGPPLILVHGLGSSAETWSPVLDALTAERSVVAVNLPGFGGTAALTGDFTIATLTDALAGWLADESLGGAPLVGTSMGARMVLELARRGLGGDVVALDPGGFWTPRQRTVFGASIKASVALVRAIQPALPALASHPAGRTALLAQFSAHPWSLPADVVLRELRGFTRAASPSLDAALRALVTGPLQEGAPRGTTPGRVTLGWGRHDKVTLPSQASRALELFPDATLHRFDSSGHFPHWDQPTEAAELILASTS